MALSKRLVDALAAVLRENAPKAYTAHDHEADDDYVQRVLPALANEQRKSTRLTAFQAELYSLPKNALVEIYADVTGDEPKEVREFADKDHTEKVGILSRLHVGQEAQTFDAFFNRISAASASLRIVKFEKAPTYGTIRRKMEAAYGRDLDKGQLPKALGSTWEPTYLVDLGEGRCCVTYSRAVEDREAVGNDYAITTLTKTEPVRLVVDSRHDVVEYRGPVSYFEKVLSTFRNTLNEHGHPCSWEPIEISLSDAKALITELRATYRRTDLGSEESSEDGLRKVQAIASRTHRDPSTGTPNLAASAKLAQIKEALGDEYTEEGWHLDFTYDGKPHTVQIHLPSHSLRFPEGKVTNATISYVIRALRKVQARANRAAS